MTCNTNPISGKTLPPPYRIDTLTRNDPSNDMLT